MLSYIRQTLPALQSPITKQSPTRTRIKTRSTTRRTQRLRKRHLIGQLHIEQQNTNVEIRTQLGIDEQGIQTQRTQTGSNPPRLLENRSRVYHPSTRNLRRYLLYGLQQALQLTPNGRMVALPLRRKKNNHHREATRQNSARIVPHIALQIIQIGIHPSRRPTI